MRVLCALSHLYIEYHGMSLETQLRPNAIGLDFFGA